ncbi:MAG TPA: HAMP domain-containing sensor histidine kinase [Pseudomonadales bacterium]|nr:HAMP domain-containing sensor histidine kinase [Pseudomonadales bacterium]
MNDQEQSNEEERVVLLESLRARTTVAPISLLGFILPPALFVPYFLIEHVSVLRIVMWVAAGFGCMFVRSTYARQMLPTLDSATFSELKSVDNRLLVSSIANQTAVGAGIWIIQSPTAPPLVVPLFVTIILIMFALGVMTNLFSDFRAYAVSSPFLLGQPIIFWLMQPQFGWAIATSLLLSILLSFPLVRRGGQIFRDSVLMRFEKNRLLEEVEHQKELTEAALEDARAANESKAFFMAAASHDIKQPLHAVGMLTDTLLMSELPPPTRSILEKQRISINRMRILFDDLMDISRFEAGAFELTRRTVDIREVVQLLDEEFSNQCADKGIAWHARSIPARVHTDPDLLVRLLANLLHNALRYTSSGSISCIGDEQNDKVAITIRDTGRGIAAEDQGKVFEQFFRVSSEEDGNIGAGLGLAIVRHVADALDIEVQLESEPGVGTQFRLLLGKAQGSS